MKKTENKKSREELVESITKMWNTKFTLSELTQRLTVEEFKEFKRLHKKMRVKNKK